MANWIQDEAAVQQLAKDILGARRTSICVVTISIDTDAPAFDVPFLEQNSSGIADFYVIKTGALTRQLQELVPASSKVFGGAARAFRPDFGRTQQPGKLHYAVPTSLKAASEAALISELWGYAYFAGLVPEPTREQRVRKATVKRLIGQEMAMVQLEDGSLAQIYSQQQFPGISVALFLKEGQQLEGYIEQGTGHFTIKRNNFDIEKLLQIYPMDSVILGLVTETNRKSATVAVHPQLSFEVPKARITHNERDVVSEYLDVGSVYSFRLIKDPHNKPALRCDDIEDDDEVLPSVSLLSGGVPWLNEIEGIAGSSSLVVESPSLAPAVATQTLEEIDASLLESEDERAEADELAERVVEPAVVETPEERRARLRKEANIEFAVARYRAVIESNNRAIAAMNDDRQRANEHSVELSEENKKLRKALAESKITNQDLKAKLRSSKSVTLDNPWDSRDDFANNEDWLRHEVYLAWIRYYEVSDRKKYPLDPSKWFIHPEFFDNFKPALLDDTQVRKAIRTVLNVVSGRNAAEQVHETHALTRNGADIHSPDGKAKALRAYVEEVASSARRLHFWQFPNGVVELCQVGVHDDYQIAEPAHK